MHEKRVTGILLNPSFNRVNFTLNKMVASIDLVLKKEKVYI